MAILKVNNVIVCNDYAIQQQRLKLAQLEHEANNVLQQVDSQLESYMLFKQQVISDINASKNRVDNKFVKAYS